MVNTLALATNPLGSDPSVLVAQLLDLAVKVVLSKQFITLIFFPGMLNIIIVAAFLVWFERKLLARVQLRVGPLYAGGLGGILQPIADGVKLIFKTPIFPEKADKPLFMLIPLAMVLVGAVPFTVIPFGEGWVISNMEVGLIFIFASLSLFPSMALLVGWASNSKFSFLGGIRSLFQQVSYEIPMWLSTLGIVIMTGSLNLTAIVKAQATVWFIIPQFLAFIVFITAIMAELERIPFDLPEAEPELVMGWMTELNATMFLFSFLAIYAKTYALSALTTVLFLGGWHGPEFLPGPVWFLIKTMIVATALILVRGSFPRVRVDLLLKIGWFRLLIIAIINIFLTLVLVETGLIPLGRT